MRASGRFGGGRGEKYFKILSNGKHQDNIREMKATPKKFQ
jgi:hypothetical protein